MQKPVRYYITESDDRPVIHTVAVFAHQVEEPHAQAENGTPVTTERDGPRALIAVPRRWSITRRRQNQ